MRDSSDAGAFVGAADVGNPTSGNGGFIATFHHEQAHAIGEILFDNRHFLRVQGSYQPGKEQQTNGKMKSDSVVHTRNPMRIQTILSRMRSTAKRKDSPITASELWLRNRTHMKFKLQLGIFAWLSCASAALAQIPGGGA